MAIPTWSQLTFLNAAQQSKAADFATIGMALTVFQQGKGPVPDTSAVTYSQAKAADLLLRDLVTLIGPAQAGIKYVRELSQKAALAANEAANP